MARLCADSQVVPRQEQLGDPVVCHAIGDASCYWTPQLTKKCIGVIIALPCFAREELNEKDAENDGYGNAANRAPKMTPRSHAELGILGAAEVSYQQVDSETSQLDESDRRARHVYGSGATDESALKSQDSGRSALNQNQNFVLGSDSGRPTGSSGGGTPREDIFTRRNRTFMKADVF